VGTVQFSFTDFVSLITETSPGFGASASVSNVFEVFDLTTSTLIAYYAPSDINVAIDSCCGLDNLYQILSESFVSRVIALAKGNSYEILVVDPSAQAEVVFEPLEHPVVGFWFGGTGLRRSSPDHPIRGSAVKRRVVPCLGAHYVLLAVAQRRSGYAAVVCPRVSTSCVLG
jgi:hypothetical protein